MPESPQLSWNTVEDPTSGERFVFRDDATSERSFAFDMYLAPQGGVPMAHEHAKQDEVFRCKRGAMIVTLDGKQQELRAGEEVTIPRGTPHAFRNPYTEECHCEVEYMPPGRNEVWFKLLGATVRTHGRGPRLLELAPFIGDVDIYLVGPPRWLQRVLFGTLKPIAIVLGYRRRMLATASAVYGRTVTW